MPKNQQHRRLTYRPVAWSISPVVIGYGPVCRPVPTAATAVVSPSATFRSTVAWTSGKARQRPV